MTLPTALLPVPLRLGLRGSGALLVLCLLAPSARAGCVPNATTPTTIVCSGTDSTGFDGSATNNLTITTDPGTTMTDADPGLDAAILVGDGSRVTIGSSTTVTVTQDGGAGIRGDDDDFGDNRGSILIEADDARGISLDQNTTGVLPNGAINRGRIEVNGDRGYALETGDNSGVANTGIIILRGDAARGFSAADKTDDTRRADITNGDGAELTVSGIDSFGMKVGDGWTGTFADTDNRPSTPTVFVSELAGTRNFGTINVSGARSTGIFAGDETNLAGDHDSNVSNDGTIAVTGTDAIAVSLGGNDRVDRFDLTSATAGRMTNRPNIPQDLVTFENFGSITGDRDAGPLVVFRDFFNARENRLVNDRIGEIVANLTDQGTPDRGVAIRGTNGIELIVNSGGIQGDIELLDGDDRYVQNAGAVYTGTIFGGAGQDQLVLTGTRGTADSFDLARLNGVETVRIMGTNTPWRLTSSAGFTGLTEVAAGGILDVPTPITLGGGLTVDAQGKVRVQLDGTTPPLTIQGSTSLDGTLQVVSGAGLVPSTTPYRIVLANGGYSGRFSTIDFTNASGTRVYTPTYDALGLQVLYQVITTVDAARGANQRAIAQNLADLTNAGGSTADLQALLADLPDVQNLGLVYDSLSPEGYDAQTTVSVEAGRRIASMLFTRARECRPGEVDRWNPNPTALPCHTRRFAPFVAALSSFRSRDGFDGHTRYDAQLGGIMAGVDFAAIDGLDLTLAVSSQGGSINTALGRNGTMALAEVTGAAAYNAGGLRVQGAVSYGHGFHQDRRRIVIDDPATTVHVKAEDDHQSDRTLVATEIGYQIPAGLVAIEPVAGFDWAWMKQDALKETGAGGFGLDVGSRDDEVGSVRAGLRLSSVYEHKTYLGPWFEWMTGIWRPNLDVAWRQYVQGNQRDLKARLQGGPDTVGGFTVQGEEDEVGGEIGAGFRFVPDVANRLRFDVRYQAYVAEHTLEQNLTGQVAIAF